MANNNELALTANVGGAFTQEFFEKAHAASPIESNFMISRMNHGILIGNFNQTGVVAIAAFATHGLLLHNHVKYRRDVFVPHLCMEVLNINMPPERMLEEEQARNMFINCTRAFAADIIENGGNSHLVTVDYVGVMMGLI